MLNLTEAKLHRLFCRHVGRDSSVGIATCYRMDSPGFESQQGQEIFLFHRWFSPAMGPTQPPNQWVAGFIPGRDDDHSSPSGAEGKNELSYNPTSLVHLHGMDRDNFTYHNERAACGST